jgi:hypothetical protein
MHGSSQLPTTALAMASLLGSTLLAACSEPAGSTAPTESSHYGTTIVSASSTSSPRRAVIIRNNGCVLLDGDGGIVEADRNIVILTHSTGRNATLICKVQGVVNSARRGVTYDSENNPLGPGTVCGIFRPQEGANVFTTAWKETVSASGNATLRCHFKL